MTPEQEVQAAEWMRQAQAGDQAAYAELLALLTSLARRYARGKVGTVPWVEDVAQETLISVHHARHTWDPGRPFAPWFYAILSHRTIDVFRRERRIGSREFGKDELPDVPESARDDHRGVDMEAVRAALSSLPSRQREIVEGLKLRDESVRELAGRLGMSESAVKVTAHRGYQALKRLLGVTRK